MPGVIVLPRHNSSSSPSSHRNRPAQPQRHHTSTPSLAPAQVAVLSATAKPSRRQRGQLQQPPSSSSPHRSTPNKNDKRRSAQHQAAPEPANLPSSDSSVSIISGNSSSSLATVSASHSPVLSSASPVTSSQSTQATTTATPARKGGRQPKSAPNTPTPANSLPVPANRRRARSPRPTQKLPGLNLEELTADDDFAPAKKVPHGNNNGKKVKALAHEPATWQQAALLQQSHPSGARVFFSLESDELF
ncbi:hypothetical protein FRB90_009751 [Tulasnella sp. 427]|nr:hypothetical protein FRB90_009751 [Tulasnella sp. 427]